MDDNVVRREKQIISRKYTLQNGSYDVIAVLSLSSSNKGFSLYNAMGESERGSDRRFDIYFATCIGKNLLD